MLTEKATVMLVDDSKADQTIIKRAMEDGGIAIDLIVTENGKEALERLRHPESGDTKPHLILLDINMPVMGGIETLTEIRADTNLKHIPIIILTTSARDKDVVESYTLGVNAYLTKPVGYIEFIEVIKQLEKFWLELVVLPSSITK